MLSFFSIHNIMVSIPFGTEAYQLSWIEAVGTLFGLLNIWLASREKTINYLFGLLNVTLFTAIFFQIQLYASMMLQVFFFVANVVGWIIWYKDDQKETSEIKIRWLSLEKFIITAVISVGFIALMTFKINAIFSMLTDFAFWLLSKLGINATEPTLIPDSYPLSDSTILVLSIVATVLMIKKYVENWIIWCALDVISVVLYAVQGVYVMSLEYLILIGIAGFGSWAWIKSAKEHGSQPLRPAASPDAKKQYANVK
ncbi:nicotinamide riboside transporter PnuC [Rouxiella sp. Mn2063]|uniref:nicotinamide riboside transporter PnuC n=1 Tax=Rouxiella sp. Mn2063 TaxID=3395262 RepID=UPI003BBC64EA